MTGSDVTVLTPWVTLSAWLTAISIGMLTWRHASRRNSAPGRLPAPILAAAVKPPRQAGIAHPGAASAAPLIMNSRDAGCRSRQGETSGAPPARAVAYPRHQMMVRKTPDRQSRGGP